MTAPTRHQGIPALTDREKDTLRLLVAGHDAKSIARDLNLSVHTINERLRDARRKLDVASSREAARLLADAERNGPDRSVDNVFGVSPNDDDALLVKRVSSRRSAVDRLAWLAGGTFIMSILIAAFAVSSAVHTVANPVAQGSPPVTTSTEASASASLGSARDWLALLDRQRWEESWRASAALFKSQIAAARWTSMIQSVRQPLGTVSNRAFRSVTRAGALPGAPAGQYEIVQFQTDFAGKRGAIETVTLAHDQAGWRVAGYFIR